MKHLTAIAVILLIPSLLCAQIDFEIPLYPNGDTTFWFKWDKQTEKQVGLTGIINNKDSFHLRLSVANYFLDIIHSRNNNVAGSLVVYTSSFSKKRPEESGKFFSTHIDLNSDTATLIYNLVMQYRIIDIPSNDSIPGWFRGHDGTTYAIQVATPQYYYFRTYWTPQHFTQIPEAVRINSFTKKVEEILETGRRLDSLISTLPINNCYRYHSMGMVCKSAEKKK